jgi:pimeloyl-ACP methyl ester carboxylesterase
VWLLLALLVLGGCATPVGVDHVDSQTVHRNLIGNVLSTGELSQFTENVLRQWGLDQLAEKDPAAALAALHEATVESDLRPDDLFTLAELSFAHAAAGGGRPYYLATAIYAYAFLFPEGLGEPPSPFDPRFRWAVDLYNRALTDAFTSADGQEFEPRGGRFRLPFGEIEVAFDESELLWSGRRLTAFVPVGEFELWGLRNRYRYPGVGAPLAASALPLRRETGFQVAQRLKLPATALLRIADARRQLAASNGGRLQASLELYPLSTTEDVVIAGSPVPLETEPSAALAYTLSDPAVWATEYQGFLFGDVLRDRPSQLVSLQPYVPGRIPVVLVHGTASSVGRWADMVNDLLSDRRIRTRFQFWFFSYETGNPIPYSAMVLRDALHDAVARLDPEGRDAALREMVVIGHSQGGLLTKMTAVDTGDRLWSSFSRRPLEELKMRSETRDLLRRALFVKSEPFVRRVVFIATPHGGSYLTEFSVTRMIADLVRLPFSAASAIGDVLTNNPDAFAFDPQQVRPGSLYGMTPGSPFITGLARIPVAPGVAAHSIIAVDGDGPLEEGSDGVVAYRSAHIDGMDSELVVRSPHSTQSNPVTIAEVRRILLLHADEACAERGIGCGLPPVQGNSLVVSEAQ